MTATNRELADRAQQIVKGSDGLRKTAARCVSVACAFSPSLDVARSALEELAMPDVRRAALALLDELAAGDAADRSGT